MIPGMLPLRRYNLHEVFQSGERTGASFSNGRTKIPDEVFKSAQRATTPLPKCNFKIHARG